MATLVVSPSSVQSTLQTSGLCTKSRASRSCSLQAPLAAPCGNWQTRASGKMLQAAVNRSMHKSGVRAASRGNVIMAASAATEKEETVFFDGGPHIGDLAANLAFGLTGVWLPLTLASLFRALNLRYRFTNKRFTIVSTFPDNERRDFPYSAVTDVKYIPRFVGEWGDIAITLKDKTIVELKAVPRFREIAKYCLEKADTPVEDDPFSPSSPKAKGFGE